MATSWCRVPPPPPPMQGQGQGFHLYPQTLARDATLLPATLLSVALRGEWVHREMEVTINKINKITQPTPNSTPSCFPAPPLLKASASAREAGGRTRREISVPLQGGGEPAAVLGNKLEYISGIN